MKTALVQTKSLCIDFKTKKDLNCGATVLPPGGAKIPPIREQSATGVQVVKM